MCKSYLECEGTKTKIYFGKLSIRRRLLKNVLEYRNGSQRIRASNTVY